MLCHHEKFPENWVLELLLPSGKKILVQKSDWPLPLILFEEKMASRTRNGGAKATEGSSGGRDGAADSGRRVQRRLSTKGDKILLSPDDIK